MNRCITGKRMYPTREIAEDALLEAWTRFDYKVSGPVAIYQCEDCGQYHFTSSGPMNERLAKALQDGSLRRHQEARRWEDKFRRK